MKRFLISPPFGNWIGHPSCTRVLGSLTLKRRPGLIRQTLKTLRPVPGGWVNAIGLRNPGLAAAPRRDDVIYSVVGLEDGDWEEMLPMLPAGSYVEVNLGCPNVHEYGIPQPVLAAYVERFTISAKLPPTEAIHDMAAMCVKTGVHYLHLSNTLPTPRGGESGFRLKLRNMAFVDSIKKKHPNTPIVAGGGIYSIEDVRAYAALGAEYFSLSTVFFQPLAARRLLREATRYEEAEAPAVTPATS